MTSKEDQETRQQDLNTLVQWSHTWGMEFNVKKCNVLSITWKTKGKRCFTYKMGGTKIDGIRDTKYLGAYRGHPKLKTEMGHSYCQNKQCGKQNDWSVMEELAPLAPKNKRDGLPVLCAAKSGILLLYMGPPHTKGHQQTRDGSKTWGQIRCQHPPSPPLRPSHIHLGHCPEPWMEVPEGTKTKQPTPLPFQGIKWSC